MPSTPPPVRWRLPTPGAARRHRRAAAARRRCRHPRQDQPDRIRQHPRARHAVRLLLARRPGAKSLSRRSSTTAGVPIVTPGGSSSGSAVAVAAGFAAAAIGTETSGSLLSPANQNGVVTVKPTVGLISRAGIIPIAHSQDTAGPLTRTVRDAAILLNVLAAPDPLDAATRRSASAGRLHQRARPERPARRPHRRAERSRPIRQTTSFTARCRRVAAAVMASRASPRWKRPAPPWCAPTCRPSAGSAGPAPRPRFSIAIRRAVPAMACSGCPIIYLYELKHDLNAYLRDWAKGTGMHSMADIIAFNTAHAGRALRFGQDIFLASAGDRAAASMPSNTSRRGAWTSVRRARSGSTPIWTATSSMPSCFRGRSGVGDRCQGRLSERAGAGRHDRRRPAGGRRRTIRSARPLRAAPGASRCCCASPMRSSRRPRRAACRRACRRSNRVARECRFGAGMRSKGGTMKDEN